MKVDNAQLAAFAAVLEEGSFEAAARRLHVTPSAVSQRIRSLEERLGQILLQRGSPCLATDAGKKLAQAWKLPEEIVEAIVAHHEPDELGSDIGNLIHVSEVLSHALDLGEQPNNRVGELSDLACASLGLSWPKLAGQFCEIEARYEGLRVALGF